MNFSEMQKLWSAIKDIDRINESGSKDKLDDIWQCINQVSKKDFDSHNTDIIIKGIRDSLLKIYIDRIKEASSEIGIDAQFSLSNQQATSSTTRGSSTEND